MYGDNSNRITKIGNAMSQLANVTLLPNHKMTTANETISGRAHRMEWQIEKVIDVIFFWEQNPRHCKRAYLSDLDRALAYIESHNKRKGINNG